MQLFSFYCSTFILLNVQSCTQVYYSINSLHTLSIIFYRFIIPYNDKHFQQEILYSTQLFNKYYLMLTVTITKEQIADVAAAAAAQCAVNCKPV